MDEKIKLGIIGFGNMGTGHTANIMGGNCPEVELVAICDINPSRIEFGKSKYPDANITYFTDAIEMLDSGLIDSCIVAVPHYDHAKYSIECMKRAIVYDINNDEYYAQMSKIYKAKEDFKTALEYIKEAESISGKEEYRIACKEMAHFCRKK